MKADIGLIGLAVMGENLVLNMERNGYTVAVYNRSVERVDDFINGRGSGKKIIPAHTLQELVASVARPRKIMLMIKAGTPVDQMMHLLMPLMEKGDVLIDAGNSNFMDTERRAQEAAQNGLLYIGTGISGGEEGALNGPSIMPGGNAKAWPLVQPIFQSIAAKVTDGTPCCDWIGDGGAGHFVKMVHNGIEYGDMQLICEIYDIMRKHLAMNCDEISEVFAQWNSGELSSYLIEITGKLLTYAEASGEHLVNKILDAAGQKGTGKWTVMSALEENVPLTLITESVFARCLSGEKDARMKNAAAFTHIFKTAEKSERAELIQQLHDALYAAKIISYAQGFELMQKAGAHYGWHLDLGNIALLWRGGCIIRSVFLEKIKDAFSKNGCLQNLIMDSYFSGILNGTHMSLRKTVSLAALAGIPTPSLSSALSWFDGVRCSTLPANLLQAQRDYFGAHTYERIDKKRGEFFHTDWTGHGGTTASTTYSV
ncbi:MAG: decarboxylating NADP(+)-dependent phosphogluconate dehydrogenase [Treponema sp.]|nr:decarboxylating NADP(+)-dependent phosphogluconate dehydrogenase [Treponema sp.]